MVSFYKALTESPISEVNAEFEASSRKRKWEEPFAEEFFKDQMNLEKKKSFFDIEPRLETPFTSDKWRQYLSIQSGQIQLCNTTWVNRTTTEDSKRNTEPPPSDYTSLDLELNLTCERKKDKDSSCDHDMNEKQNSGSSTKSLLSEHSDHDLCIDESSKCTEKDDSGGGLIRSTTHPSWLSSSDEGDYKEMVATVCMRCHMLVMLCKSSPACPNCKFMHPPDQNPSTFLNRRCGFFCSG